MERRSYNPKAKGLLYKMEGVTCNMAKNRIPEPPHPSHPSWVNLQSGSVPPPAPPTPHSMEARVAAWCLTFPHGMKIDLATNPGARGGRGRVLSNPFSDGAFWHVAGYVFAMGGWIGRGMDGCMPRCGS